MKDIMLKITGKTVRQDEGREKHEDIMEFVTAGQLFHRGSTTFIKYPESELSGLEGCTTSLIITKDKVKMRRSGNALAADTEMEFKKGERFYGMYETPYGPIGMELLTNDRLSHQPEGLYGIQKQTGIGDHPFGGRGKTMNRKQERNKKLARILAIVVVISMLMMTGFTLLAAFSGETGTIYVYAAESQETIDKNLSKLDQLRDVVQYIDENYADDVNVEDLTDAAYNGVFDALDQWSVFYKTKEEKDAFISQVTGNYAGIGVTMTLDGSGNCVITQVNTLGPAYEAGVTAGMIIRSVDGKSISGMTLDQISSLVRGEPGTKAVLQLESNGALQTMEIERKNIKAQTVTYQMLDNKIGYIAISQFSGETWLEFRTAKLNLIADGMEKLIVDVRDNGGGVMGDALNIAGMLIPQGKPLVFYEQQGEIIDEEYSAGGIYKDVPLVVLINDHTASASECLAAAVKDNGAGTLVGVTTYGKGVAQELVTMDNGDSFKLTFCHFLTPNKQRIDKVGIAPDIAISNGSALTQEQIAKYLESVLPMDEGKKYFKGQRGLNVLAAQQRLNILGYKVPQNAVMEAATMDALKRIQALYGASPYGGLDFCTIELVDRAFYEFLYGDGTDKQLQKAIEVLQ